MALLSKAALASAIAAASQVSFKSVYVPALGGDVNVKIQTVAEREAMEDASFGKNKNKQPFRAVIFANAVVDEKGERLYKDEDIAAIANYPASIVMPVFNAYNEYNGITVEKVDEAEKNS